MLKLLAVATLLASSLLTTGCLDEGRSPAHVGQQVNQQSQHVDSIVVAPDSDEVNVCDMLPTDGACAAACNPAALQAFISPGTCVEFECELADGQSIRVGGCRPPH